MTVPPQPNGGPVAKPEKIEFKGIVQQVSGYGLTGVRGRLYAGSAPDDDPAPLATDVAGSFRFDAGQGCYTWDLTFLPPQGGFPVQGVYSARIYADYSQPTIKFTLANNIVILPS